jgi:polar amino acid transport system substrate-binding protein
MRRIIAGFIAVVLSGSLLFAESLTIYTEIEPPDQFLGPDGKLTGCSYEIVREVQRRVQNADPIEAVPWVRGYKELQGRPNVVLFSIARSKDRDSLFEWVGPIGEIAFVFYARADSPISIKNLDEARKLIFIGVYKEDIRDQHLTKLGFTNLDRSIDDVTILKKLMAGRIDCMVANAAGISDLTISAGYKPEDVRAVFPFLKVQLYIAFSKATPRATVMRWQKALDDMKSDGTFERIYRKYRPNSPIPGPALKPF